MALAVPRIERGTQGLGAGWKRSSDSGKSVSLAIGRGGRDRIVDFTQARAGVYEKEEGGEPVHHGCLL